MPQSDLIKQDVRGQLSGLRHRIQSRLVFEGLAWIVLAVVAVVFGTLGLDYMMRFTLALRALVMLAALVALGYVFWRHVIRPLQVTMNEEDLALLVERRYGQLGDRLISALQFSKATDLPPGTSVAMIHRVGVEANELARKLSFETVVERENLRRRLLLALCATVVLAGFSVWQSNAMGLWFQRNILFRAVDWPQDTYLKVVNPKGTHDFKVLRGDDLVVKVIADVRPGTDQPSLTPPYVVFHAHYASVGDTEERVDVGGDGKTFEKKFQAVSEEFRFYVTGGDDSRDKAKPHEVTLIDPPSLKDMAYSVSYPRYMNRQASRPEPVKGIIAVPLGCQITFQGACTKDLKAAKMLLDDVEIGAVQIGLEGAADKRTLVGKFDISGANKLTQRMLRFMLTDSDGYDNRRGQQFLIQVQPDLPPSVDLKTYGISQNITANAIIPVTIASHDDYGVASAQMSAIQVKKSSTASSQAASLPTTSSKPSTQPTQAWGEMKDLTKAPDGGKDFKTADHVDLDTLEPKANVNDVIAVVVEVVDTMDAGLGGPNKKTAAVELKIVPPTEVEADLAKRMDDLALEFAQALLVQTTCVENTNKAAEDEGAAPARTHVNESRSGQIAVGTQCAAASQKIQAVVEEMDNNRVYPELSLKLKKDAVDALKELQTPIEAASNTLNQAFKILEGASPDMAKVNALATTAAEQQEDIRIRVAKVLKVLNETTTRAQAINQVHMIMKAWDKLLKDTEIEKNREAGLLGTTKPASAPATNP